MAAESRFRSGVTPGRGAQKKKGSLSMSSFGDIAKPYELPLAPLGMGVSVPSPARSRNASMLLSNVSISVHVEKFTTSALGGSSSAKYVSGLA